MADFRSKRRKLRRNVLYDRCCTLLIALACVLSALWPSTFVQAAVSAEMPVPYDASEFGNYQQEADTRSYAVSLSVIETSLDRYFTVPYLSGGRMLAQNLRVGELPSPPRTIFYDLATGVEEDLNLDGDDPVFSGSKVYYLNPYTGDEGAEKKIIRFDLSSGTEDIIYETAEAKITAVPVLAGSYIAWYEDLSGGAGGEGYRIVVFDLEQNQVVFTQEDVALPYLSAAPGLCENAKIVISDQTSDGIRVRLLDFRSGAVLFETFPGEIPRAVDYSNGILALGFCGRVDVYSTVTQDLLVRLRHDTGGDLTDVRVISGRIVVYGTSAAVYAVDLLDGFLLYDSDRDYNEMFEGSRRFKHVGWFEDDAGRAEVLYRFDDCLEDNRARLMLLTFYPE
jgi:hypothetical protein